MNASDFIRKWTASQGTERSTAQEHFLDVCELMNHPKPREVDPLGFRIKFRIVADSARFKEYEAKLHQAAFAPIHSLVEFVDYDNLSNLHAKIAASIKAEDSTKL